MKKIVSICGITTNAFAQGGPNGPPNPAWPARYRYNKEVV